METFVLLNQDVNFENIPSQIYLHWLLYTNQIFNESLANTLVMLFLNNSMSPLVITVLFIVYNNIFREF